MLSLQKDLLVALAAIVNFMIPELSRGGALLWLTAVFKPFVESWQFSSIGFDHLHGFVIALFSVPHQIVALGLPNVGVLRRLLLFSVVVVVAADVGSLREGADAQQADRKNQGLHLSIRIPLDGCCSLLLEKISHFQI